MEVNNYFPDGISAVHHDESNPELALCVNTATEPTYQDIFPSPCPEQIESQRVQMSRLVDPPITPPYTITTHGRQSFRKLPIPIHCHLCYRKLVLTITSGYFKPCNCELIFVHIECAQNEPGFFENRCSECGVINSHKALINGNFLSSPLISPRRIGGSDNMDIDSAPHRQAICGECHNEKYVNPPLSQKFDACFIQPCFCSTLAHQGCMREVVKSRPMCQTCGVKYMVIKYGTVADYFKRYYAEHILYLLIVALLIYLSWLPTSSLFFSTYPDYSIEKVTLIVLTCLFIFTLIAFIVMIIRCTQTRRFPYFRERYGRIMVKSYDPNVQSRKAAIRSLKESRKIAIPEEYPLTGVYVGAQQRGTENASVTEQARHDNSDDLTLGQHMFGICPTHQSSSTPIIGPPGGFVFEKIDEE